MSMSKCVRPPDAPRYKNPESMQFLSIMGGTNAFEFKPKAIPPITPYTHGRHFALKLQDIVAKTGLVKVPKDDFLIVNDQFAGRS